MLSKKTKTSTVIHKICQTIWQTMGSFHICWTLQKECAQVRYKCAKTTHQQGIAKDNFSEIKINLLLGIPEQTRVVPGRGTRKQYQILD